MELRSKLFIEVEKQVEALKVLISYMAVRRRLYVAILSQPQDFLNSFLIFCYLYFTNHSGI